MLLNAIERNLFELHRLFLAGVTVPEKLVCGELEGEKNKWQKIFEKVVDKAE
ncbi:hypothetical protein [Nostoc parmelioides]|uniref:hypothetical protein n=1 Tax=Nostoc parmelioides TaxID=1521621 RepID=UPI0016892E96|nr:hypothetical protein [Nostoc parmelioides]